MTLTYHSGRRLQGLSTDFQTSGLKAYWKMNESSGNLLNTASAQNSDSTMSADLVSSGTVNRGTAGHVSGVDSIGFPTYDADGNKVTANNSASDYGFMNKAAAKFTACWWAKNESHNSTVDLWGLGGNGNGADISFRNKSSGFTIWFSGTEYTSFTHNVGDNNWHFYMLSWDEDGGSDNAQFQLDGTKQTATITTSNTSDSASTLTIGDVSGNEPEMDIQEFSLWNRVLTDAEIALIYNSGNGAELQNTTIVGSKPNNVQVGSRLEETDTRKIYNFSTPEYKIHTFTSTGNSTFAVTGSGDIEYLVIAGGGGGGVDTYSGGRGAGGGGAGGFRTNVSGATSGGGASAEATYNVTAQNYTITVGTGGAGGANTNGTGVIGSDGVNSSIVPASGTSIISTGGGGGGGHDNSANYSGRNGGSGGGAPNGTGSLTGTGVSGQGFAGGNPSDSSPYSGSGGGGSGSIGGASSGGNAGDGGAGTASSISGSLVTYAGGGGANGMTSSGSGGSGGGGAGGSGGAGTANTGSGGGGDRQSTGGAGGSGIVIIRYLTSSGITATGGTITTADDVWQEIGA